LTRGRRDPRPWSLDPLRTDQWDLQIITLALDQGALAVVEVNKDPGPHEVGGPGSSGIVATPALDSPVVRHDGELRQHVHSDWLGRFEEAYIREIQQWTAGVLEGTPNGPSAWDGLQSLAVALAGVASVDRGSPVRLEPYARPVLYA
jgi:myo-inositol 2-dehydrogenase/D-chiro-inositol 1-dehydrogenase